MLPRRRGDPVGLSLPCSGVVLLTRARPVQNKGWEVSPPPPLGASRKAWTCPHAERRLRRGGVQSAGGGRVPETTVPSGPEFREYRRQGPVAAGGCSFSCARANPSVSPPQYRRLLGAAASPRVLQRAGRRGTGLSHWRPVRGSRPER